MEFSHPILMVTERPFWWTEEKPDPYNRPPEKIVDDLEVMWDWWRRSELFTKEERAKITELLDEIITTGYPKTACAAFLTIGTTRAFLGGMVFRGADHERYNNPEPGPSLLVLGRAIPHDPQRYLEMVQKYGVPIPPDKHKTVGPELILAFWLEHIMAIKILLFRANSGQIKVNKPRNYCPEYLTLELLGILENQEAERRGVTHSMKISREGNPDGLLVALAPVEKIAPISKIVREALTGKAKDSRTGEDWGSLLN